jgi:hypothetical protein
MLMPLVTFGDYEYVPVLASTEVERLAYGHLKPDTRAGILPLFELTRHRGAETLQASIDLVQDTVELPFLLDLDKRYAPPPYQSTNPSNFANEQQRVARETQENDAYNAYLASLLAPNNGFERWRDICGMFANAIPVIQFTNPAAQENSILRQSFLLSQGGNSVALRIGQAQHEVLLTIATRILATLPHSSQLLLIFDCGQGRRGVAEKTQWVLECLSNISSRLEPEQTMGLSVVCMSNSYPQMNHSGLKIVPNCDRRIWEAAYEQFPFHFGDYAASPRSPNLSAFLPRKFRATVVHSQNEQWLVHRHENSDDPHGWVIGSQIISADSTFDAIDTWTDNAIVAAADGNIVGMNTPRPWHAARIAGHIDRQFRYQPSYDDFDDLLG